MRFDCLEVHENLAFIVGRTPRVNLTISHRRLKGRRFPKLEWIDRLYVVMPIVKDGWRAFCPQPLAVNDWMAVRLVKPNLVQSDPTHFLSRPFRATPHVRRVLGQRANARNGEVGLQLVDIAISVRVNEIDNSVHVALRDADRPPVVTNRATVNAGDLS